MFRLRKKKIFLFYNYFFFEDVLYLKFVDNEEENWFKTFLSNEEFLKKKIEDKLKDGWNFSSLPLLEKSILAFSAHQLFFVLKEEEKFILIDQVVNFSKVYLEEDKFKYINKVLDLLVNF